MAAQPRDGAARAERLLALRERYREQAQTARPADPLLQAVDLLFTRPAATVRGVEAALQVNFATAQRYTAQPEQAGMVRAITGRARGRAYEADEVVAAIERPVTREERATR